MLRQGKFYESIDLLLINLFDRLLALNGMEFSSEQVYVQIKGLAFCNSVMKENS